MTQEMLLIAIVRIAGSLPVLRWPLYGGVLALLVDQSDLFIMNLVDLGGVRGYQTFDKYLDQVYLLAFLVTAWRWGGGYRLLGGALYAYRFVGFLAFELTQERSILLLFPNFFEFWFLLAAADRQFHLRRRLPMALLTTGVAFFIALKLFQEYAIHHRRWLDAFTAVEAVQAIWRWLTAPLS